MNKKQLDRANEIQCQIKTLKRNLERADIVKRNLEKYPSQHKIIVELYRGAVLGTDSEYFTELLPDKIILAGLEAAINHWRLELISLNEEFENL